MTRKSVSPESLLRIQDKINDDPDELAEFIKEPGNYLECHGVQVSKKYSKELKEAVREMRLGPKSFDELTRLRQSPLGIGISIAIRIRF